MSTNEALEKYDHTIDAKIKEPFQQTQKTNLGLCISDERKKLYQ